METQQRVNLLDELISGERNRSNDRHLKETLQNAPIEGFRRIAVPPYLEYVGPTNELNNNNNYNANNISNKSNVKNNNNINVNSLNNENDYNSLPSDEVIDEAYYDSGHPDEQFHRHINTYSDKDTDSDTASIHSTDTFHDEASVYSSTVSIPAFYCNRKKIDHIKPKNILRKFSGLPLAALYGVLFYVIMEYMILSTPDSNLILNITLPRDNHHHDEHRGPAPYAIINLENNYYDSDNHTQTNATGRQYMITYAVLYGEGLEDDQTLFHGNTSKERNSSRHDHWHSNHTHTGNNYHRPEVIYASVALSVGLGFASLYSRGTRCSMLLILPGLVTRRSKTLLLTLVAGLLAKHPIRNLFYNLNEILKSTGCLYAQVTTNFGLILDVIREKMKAIEKDITIPGIGTMHLKFDVMTNFTSWEALRNMIKAPHITEIKHRMAYIAEQTEKFGYYANIVRQILTGVSIILIVVDAVKYLRLYYSDSSFDNKYIDHLTTQRWRKKKYKQLTPLRNWEYKYGYKTPGKVGKKVGKKVGGKIGKKEFMQIFHQALPTVLFLLFAFMVIACDYLLSSVIEYVKDRKTFEISFDGVDADLMRKLTSFNISADACLSHPMVTDWPVYLLIVLLLVFAAVSCIFEVFMTRIRARVCNFFYTDRAEERADYLHYRISAGRNIRRMQLKLKVRRELERRERLKEFSPCSHFMAFFCRCCGVDPWVHVKRFFCLAYLRGKPLKVKCPGCGWSVVPEEMENISFVLGKSRIMNKICKDCHLEFTVDQTPDNFNFAVNKMRKGRLHKSMPLLRDDYSPMHGTL